jgi:DNA ligase-associated metallophosphoesterase
VAAAAVAEVAVGGDVTGGIAGDVARPRTHALTIAGQQVVLHPERALEFPAHRLLVIADVHWGKATTLRAHGIPVPRGGTRDDLARLDRLLLRTGASQLLVLGDLVHSRHAWHGAALEPVLAWRERWAALSITLVRGNHDAHAGDPPPAMRIDTVDAPFAIAGVHAAHEPPAGAHHLAQAPGTPFTLCGHLHPNVALAGRGGDRLRLPCFVHGAGQLILPAFSTFTGRGAWTPDPQERVFAIVDDEMIEVVPRYG